MGSFINIAFSLSLLSMKQVIIIAVTIIFFFSCSSIKITSDKDGSVDFDQHKTWSYYGWAEESDKILNRFEKERIENAFGEEFRKLRNFLKSC